MRLTTIAPVTYRPMEIALYPDQQECFGPVEAADRALVVTPTGWGKTILFLLPIRWWSSHSEKPVSIIAY